MISTSPAGSIGFSCNHAWSALNSKCRSEQYCMIIVLRKSWASVGFAINIRIFILSPARARLAKPQWILRNALSSFAFFYLTSIILILFREMHCEFVRMTSVVLQRIYQSLMKLFHIDREFVPFFDNFFFLQTIAQPSYAGNGAR